MAQRQKDGFTIMELMLAAGILAVVITGLIQLFLTCRYLNETNQNLVVAVSHAQFVMEAIKGSSSSVSTIETAISNGSWNLSTSDIEDAPFEFSVLYNETVTADVFLPNNTTDLPATMRGINVTVRWRQGTMLDHDYTLQTMVAQ